MTWPVIFNFKNDSRQTASGLTYLICAVLGLYLYYEQPVKKICSFINRQYWPTAGDMYNAIVNNDLAEFKRCKNLVNFNINSHLIIAMFAFGRVEMFKEIDMPTEFNVIDIYLQNFYDIPNRTEIFDIIMHDKLMTDSIKDVVFMCCKYGDLSLLNYILGNYDFDREFIKSGIEHYSAGYPRSVRILEIILLCALTKGQYTIEELSDEYDIPDPAIFENIRPKLTKSSIKYV